MKLSYWEYKSWLSQVDFTVVGSGIVGLHCALYLRTQYPRAKIIILDKGIIPQGASTKNAGFACFGSISEILADLKTHTEKEVLSLVQQRWEGIEVLRRTLGDAAITYHSYGGHELFLAKEEALYNYCLANMNRINELLEPVFQTDAFCQTPNDYGFSNVKETYITNKKEGQLDTGEMMLTLARLVQSKKIVILNGVCVEDYIETASGVTIKTDKFEFNSKKLCLATNGFAHKLFPKIIKPARAQVLITKPIKNLHIKGTFHMDEGYYYFRNVENRILLGGGRNLDFKREETTTFETTQEIQDQLKVLLETVILPKRIVEIDKSWSGIMGVGPQKYPIVKQLSTHIACGVRLGGMGIAIGAFVGKRLANRFR